MAGESFFHAGNEAFVDDDFDEAIAQYTEAIKADPSREEYYVKRSAAYMKTENYTEVVQDTNSALKVNGRCVTAFLRKGTALFHLKEFEAALETLKEGQKLGESESQFRLWIRKCEAEIAAESGARAEATTSVATTSTSTSAPAAAPPAKAPDTRPRHDWYQSSANVVVTIFLKNTTKEATTIVFGPRSADLTVNVDGNTVTAHWDFCDEINPDACSFSNNSANIEVKLAKVNKVQWATLESDPNLKFTTRPVADTSGVDKTAYPSSSKKKVDWDKVVHEVEKTKDEEGDALNKLFQQIYSGANEDTRRAMMKSFVESNGTVLSTNWKEVGSKYVEGTPPEGMEMHSWTELEKERRKAADESL